MVVKLGGSIITRKQEVERARPKVLARLAAELSTHGPVPLIVLHGAGSFGHPGAKRWGLAIPPPAGAPSRDRARGAAIVQAEVRRLHAKVIAALLEAGVNPVSIPAATLSENTAGLLSRFDPAPFLRALDLGTTPVSFGDVVPDSEWGFSILSADTIAIALAKAVHPSRVVFVSDVPGLFRDPKQRREIHPALTDDIVRSIGDHVPGPDVTGGISAKANAMLAIGRLGVDAGLISGLSDGALSRAIRGEAVYGTWTSPAARASEGPTPVAHERA